MFVRGAQYLQIIRHCPISHLSLLCVCGNSMFCNRLLASGLPPPFSLAVLNYSPRVPPLCTFCTFFLSLQMFVLFDCKCPTKWTSHHRIFHYDSSSKRTYICSIQRALKCARLNLNKGILCHTLPLSSMFHTCLVCSISVWRRCRQRRSANPWMNVLKWSKPLRISPAQGVGSNVHCVWTM